MTGEEITAMNFDRVDETLTRSGLPSFEDLEILKNKYQVKTVVNFCTRANILNEAIWTKDLGLNYIHLPWSAHFYKILIPGYYNRIVKKFLTIIENPENHPVHVHCFHGRERTGVMVAAYRITKHGYSFAEVIKEMKNYGFKPHLHFTLVLYLFLFSIL